MMRDYDTLARRVIRCLLDDDGPVPSFTEEELGPWHESVSALREAYAEGGAGAVHRVFITLARRQPALIHLVAGGDAAHKTVWTAAEFFATDFPPPVFVVEELLPRGLSILAGRPKLGKSWLLLQIAGVKNVHSPTPHPAAGTAAPRPDARCGSPPRRPGRRWYAPASARGDTPRAQLHLPHRRAHEILACCVDRAEFLHLGRAHVAVDEHVGLAQLGEAFVLDLARRFYPAADHFRGLTALE